MVFNYVFKNNGLGLHNDDVFDHLFELIENEYTFKIKPNSTTKFWRLGIRLSKNADIEFYHPEGRYVEPGFSKYIDIHLGVGEWDNKEWTLQKRMHLAQYNLFSGTKDHILDRKETYVESGKIDWQIKYLNRKKSIYISYKAEGCELFSNSYLFDNEYKYFKVFAWAEKNEFEINCKIQSKQVTQRKRTTKSQSKLYSETDSGVCISDDLNPVIEVKELAKEVSEILELLRDPTGNMFGIFGKWGRGKTYLWKQISEVLEKEKDDNEIKFNKVEFHAWKYQDTPASWAYLYESLADKYFAENRLKFYKEKNKSNKAKELWLWLKDSKCVFLKRVKLNSVRKGHKPFMSFIIGLSISIIWLFLIPFLTKIEFALSLISTIGIVFIAKLFYLYFIYKPKAIDILSTYSEKISFQKYLGLQAEIQKEIIFLLQSWIPENKSSKKILLFVDDIDRCNEEKIIQVVDSLKVMLEDPEIAKRMTILVAIDERVLKMAINNKYHDLIVKTADQMEDAETTPNKFLKTSLNKLSKEYIDKLFISGIKLGVLSKDDKNKILDSITNNKILEIVQQEEKEVESNKSSSTSTTTATTLPPKVEMHNQIRQTNQNDNKEITRDEYNLIKSALNSYQQATPRSIRIYYYRYLLARKIIRYKLNLKLDLASKWDELNQDKLILLLMIIHFSISSDSNEFEKELDQLENNNNNKKIKRTFLKKDFSIDHILYKELLRVVEMVVPY